METHKRKEQILQEIAEALKEWGKYNQKDADESIRKSPKARQATKNAMELLLDNLGILYEVRQEYGCHQPLQKLFGGLSDVASKRDKQETYLGAYWVWGKDFTQPQLCMGNVSFIDECLRWASLERAKAKGSLKTNPTKSIGAQPEQKAAADKNEGGNVNIVNISAKKVQVDSIQQAGHDASLQKNLGMEEKKSGGIKKILKIISAIVVFLAALFTCLGYLLGWLEPIKAFIYRIISK